MKKITLSAVTALLVASSAFAVDTKIDNVKVEGAAGLYYNTDDKTATDTNGALFGQSTSIADVFVSLKVTADLNKKVKGGIAATTVSTLGLENNLVSNTFSGSHPNTVDDYTVVTEAWLEISAGEKTTVTLGRQKLDTPLVFSEAWSVMPNTYEATVIANKSFENVTLIGAFVGRGNGPASGGPITSGGEFGTFGADSNTSRNGGAYALGAIYSMGDMTIQAWGYDVLSTADTTGTYYDGYNAMWVEAEQAPENGLGFGAQYTTVESKASTSTLDSNAMAAKITYAKKDAFSVMLAYSQTDKNGTAAFNVGGGSQSKLYTEAWWNYGYVTKADTTAMNITAEYSISKTLEAGLYITQTDTVIAGSDMSEATISLAKDYDGFKATLLYIQTDAEDQNIVSGTTGSSFGTIQVYLDAEF